VLRIETVVLDIAMDSARTEHLDAVAAAPDSMIFNSQGRLADLALKSGLPHMGTNLDDATAGALLAYGPNHADIFRRSAAVVDKILKSGSRGCSQRHGWLVHVEGEAGVDFSGIDT
jgi:hypothetical protein